MRSCDGIGRDLTFGTGATGIGSSDGVAGGGPGICATAAFGKMRHEKNTNKPQIAAESSMYPRYLICDVIPQLPDLAGKLR
jgi:hypothetical protein